MSKKRILSAILAVAMAITLLVPSSGASAASLKVKKIAMVTKNVTLNVGEKKKLKVKITPKTLTKKAKKSLKWKSSDKTVAKVSKKGVVTAQKAGKATITVSLKTSKKTLKAKCRITVNAAAQQTPGTETTQATTPEAAKIAVTKVSVSENAVSIVEGSNCEIKATVAPENASNQTLNYTSSDEGVAVVDEKGVITAISQGTAKVTVEAADGSGQKAEIEVTVTEKERPRAIITQDCEVDDKNTVAHMLLYANEIDIEGIVATSSMWHWAGDENATVAEYGTIGGMAAYGFEYNQECRWPGTDWMYEYIDAYKEVYPYLKAQDSNYPAPNYLRSVTKVGNIGFEGDMVESTDGSNLIKNAILDDDERTLYLLACGGTNTVAKALSDIEESYKNEDGTYKDGWTEMKAKIEKKVVLMSFGKQDLCYDNYIALVYPEIQFLDVAETTYGYNNMKKLKGETLKSFQSAYMEKYIEFKHGALMDCYVTWGDGTYLDGEGNNGQYGTDEEYLASSGYDRYDFISEGDSPAFFFLLDTGLRNLEDEGYGSYAGRYARITESVSGYLGSSIDPVNKNGVSVNYWVLQNDFSMLSEDSAVENEETDGQVSDLKWLLDVQHEFATRAEWCVADTYADANHEPSLSIEQGVDISAAAGETVELRAIASDPDGDDVSVSWAQYVDAGTYDGEVALSGADTEQISFTVPENAKSGDTIHIIAKVADDAELSLSHYQQIIVTVK